LDDLLARKDDVITSPAILAELAGAFKYPRVVKHFGLTESEVCAYLTFLEESMEIVALEDAPIPPIAT
jgi:hypothetical protein